jgi:hypothetical protein
VWIDPISNSKSTESGSHLTGSSTIESLQTHAEAKLGKGRSVELRALKEQLAAVEKEIRKVISASEPRRRKAESLAQCSWGELYA